MPIDIQPRTLTVALIGNPNTGKSTLFNALVGIHQHVGNYPGVTVEKKSGRVEHEGRHYEVIDLPGLYSLAPRSPDEMVAMDVLVGRCEGLAAVDAVVCLIDASNLQRHLYLVSQVLEFGLPTVVAVNMLDVAESHGIRIELARLQARLGVAVVPMQAHRKIGLAQLKTALEAAVQAGPRGATIQFPPSFEAEVDRLAQALETEFPLPLRERIGVRGKNNVGSASPFPSGPEHPLLSRCLVRRLLLDVNGYLQETLWPDVAARLDQQLTAARARLAKAGCPVPGVETTARYAWVRSVLDGVVTEPRRYKTTASDRLDHVLTHRFWGMLIFALLMFLVFQAVFVWAKPLMKSIDTLTAVTGHAVERVMAEGALRSLLVDGVIGGVGGVLAFLPQILILFAFIAILEDCGYMARAAFLMDRVMVRVGLNGRSFIPMLSSFACAVPGIMAARVIENERDRMTTILVAPLMTCSARLPIYALLIAAFIPEHSYCGIGLQGLTLTALYALGIIVAVLMALLLKRTMFRGKTPPFLMELPSYKWPAPQTVVMRVGQRGWIFLRTAGTLILAVSIVVWAALYYPHDRQVVRPLVDREAQLTAQLQRLPAGDPQRPHVAEDLAEVGREITGEYQRHSVLGHLGRTIEPVVRPLGWDWRIGCAVLASFPAREVVVATLGVIYNLGKDVDLESDEGAGRLRAKLRSATWDGSERPVFTIPVALSIMVFFALCAQCAATLAVIRRETNSWRWPAFTFAYMTTLAYFGALVTYQFGTWLGG